MVGPNHGGELISSGYQGVVYKIKVDPSSPELPESDSQYLIVKETMGSAMVRRLRRFMLRREYAVYRRLEGIAGIPRCYGLEDGNRLILEFIDGHSLRLSKDELPDREAFFSALFTIILAAHRAGVAHADLKRKENILVTTGGYPRLIDFGSAVMRKESGGAWNRWLFGLACQIDLNAWIKHKYLGRYDEISADDEKYFRPTLIERGARKIRRTWRKLTRRRWRKTRGRLHRQDRRTR